MSEEYKVQWSVSLPPAAQYAKGHMLNIRGDSVEEVVREADKLTDDAIQVLADAAAALVASQVVAEAFAGGGSEKAGEAQSSHSSSGAIKTCEHGKREYRTGKGRTGTWAAYFCPLDKNDANKCDPIWED